MIGDAPHVPEYLTAAQAAAVVGTDVTNVKRACRMGQLKAYKAAHLWLITANDLIAWEQATRDRRRAQTRRRKEKP
jgi:hypothetical protein